MTKQKSTPAVKTIEEAKTQCRRAKGKQRYVATETWLTKFRYWYSPSGKRYKSTASAIAIYSYIVGLNEQGKECYANQKTLGEIGSVESRQARNIIRMLEDVGVIHVEGRDGQTSLYTALPFTDAHVIPSDPRPVVPVIFPDDVQHQPAPIAAPESNKTAAEHLVPDWDDIPCVWDDPAYQPTPTIPIQQDKPELPWGGLAICKKNGNPTDAAVEWALTETMGDEAAAYRLISMTATKYLGREVIYTIPTNEIYDDFEIPF